MCCRMYCQNCEQEGWHQSWCKDYGRTNEANQDALPWIWPPVLNVVNPDAPWSEGMVDPGVELFPQLEPTGIVVAPSQVQVMGDPMISGLNDGNLTTLNSNANSENVEEMNMAVGGATDTSVSSWDLIEEVIKNNDRVNQGNCDDELKDLTECFERNDRKQNHNTPVEGENEMGQDVNELWKSATDLAAALTRYAEKEGMEIPIDDKVEGKPQRSVAESSQGRCEGCEQHGACGVSKSDSPASPGPDMNENRDWRSDTSGSESRDQPYKPVVSAVSSEQFQAKKVQGEIDSVVRKHGGYWDPKHGPRRVAVVRPRSRDNRAWLARRRTYMPLEFRMSTHAPVIHTREVVSRVQMQDGTIVEESLQSRFVLARTVATQTCAQDTRARFEPMDLPTLTFEDITVPEVEVVIDLTGDSEEGEVDVSSGTPLQDEKQ